MRRGALPSSPKAPAVRSWEIRPTIGPVAPTLNELWTLGTTVRTSTFVIGEVDGPEVVERVSERQDLVAVHLGDGPHGRHVEVAAHELDADGVALLEAEPGEDRALPGLPGRARP